MSNEYWTANRCYLASAAVVLDLLMADIVAFGQSKPVRKTSSEPEPKFTLKNLAVRIEELERRASTLENQRDYLQSQVDTLRVRLDNSRA